jgi:hypothetical protein
MAADALVTIETENGAVLLDDISRFIARFLVLTPAQAHAAALWVLHTHALDAAEFTPYLHIYSPMLRSGKTLLLNVLALLVAKPWLTGRVTGAVLVRKTDKERPTLLLDEADAAFQAEHECAEALRGILNTGFQRGGQTSICVKKAGDWTAQDFQTFAPKAIAGIGRLPHTIEDRSVPIELKRKRRGEERERFRIRKVRPQGAALHERAKRWATQNVEGLRSAEPSLPEDLNDRQQDVCEPLLAIADRVGGVWPARARRALVELCSNRPAQDGSLPLRLLTDIRVIFECSRQNRLASAELLKALTEDETAPWREAGRGKPMTASQLATMLRPFGISPRDLRMGLLTLKGYTRADFEDSWERYLESPSATPAREGQQGRQDAIHAGVDHFSEGQQERSVADAEIENQAGSTRVVADVAPASPPNQGGSNRKMRVRGCWNHPFDASWRQNSDGTWVCGHCREGCIDVPVNSGPPLSARPQPQEMGLDRTVSLIEFAQDN